jgi:hypothetical protein
MRRVHGKQKTQYRDFGESAFCAHGKHNAQCSERGGAPFCAYGNSKRIVRTAAAYLSVRMGTNTQCHKRDRSGFCAHGKHVCVCVYVRVYTKSWSQVPVQKARITACLSKSSASCGFVCAHARTCAQACVWACARSCTQACTRETEDVMSRIRRAGSLHAQEAENALS